MSNSSFSQDRVSGIPGISAAFRKALLQRSAALMPYYTLGYPDLDTSLDVIEAIAPYSDLMELGVPFSDPIADGPTIQKSTQRALENGVTSAMCLDMVRELRSRNVQIPLLLMGYYNPILAYGEERYIHGLKSAGADGLLVPDLPPEESEELDSLSINSNLAMIYFSAPTSNSDRLNMIVPRARGFIYLVSVTGVTGARGQLSKSLAEDVAKIRAMSDIPVAIGFGISTPEQASEVGQIADGVIVGSALINVVDKAIDKPEAASSFIRQLRQAL